MNTNYEAIAEQHLKTPDLLDRAGALIDRFHNRTLPPVAKDFHMRLSYLSKSALSEATGNLHFKAERINEEQFKPAPIYGVQVVALNKDAQPELANSSFDCIAILMYQDEANPALYNISALDHSNPNNAKYEPLGTFNPNDPMDVDKAVIKAFSYIAESINALNIFDISPRPPTGPVGMD